MAKVKLLVCPAYTYNTVHHHILTVLEGYDITDLNFGGYGSAYPYHIASLNHGTHTV
jgi:hypothetical protein